MAKKTWFSITAAQGANAPEVLLYDEIGAYGIDATDFKGALDKIPAGDDFDLRVNSPGGNVFVGNAIYNMLKDKAKAGANITVYIDGVAASMASMIAMVGETVVMPENATLMIHNPAGVAIGGSKDMRRISSLLDMLKEGMITAYVSKSGLSRDEVAAIMDEETWFDAQQAVDYGFADKVEGSVAIAATNGFDLSKYKHPPEALSKGKPRGKSAQSKESIDMTPDEIKALIAAENKPILDALAKLTPAEPVAKGDKDVETPEAMEKRIKAEGKAYRDEVRSLCGLAGMADKAEAFISEETPVADVRKALADEQAKGTKNRPAPKANATPAPNNHRGSEDGEGSETDHSDLVATSLDSRSIWASWNGKGKQGQRSAA